MATAPNTTHQKKNRISRILGLVLAILILPIVIGYFVITSSTFFKKVILPKVGASMNSSITVADVSIKPFSQVVLKQLTVTPSGEETLLKAEEVRVRYSLMDIIKGKITVHEATLVSPVITVVEAADGSKNTDPITEGEKQENEKPDEKSKSEKPADLNIQNVSLKNGLVQQTKHLEGGGREFTEIGNLNVSIDRLSNGQPGKLDLGADIRMDRVPSAGTTNGAPGSLRGKLAGTINYKLTADVLPELAKGSMRFAVSEAKGDMADLAQLSATLNCDVTPSDIRELSLQFSQGGQALGALRASGPFSFANTEGNLKVELSSIDRHVLNLAGASKGLDFNSTLINSTNDIAISQKGNVISIHGQLNAHKFSITKTEKQTTPMLELQAAYQLNVDQSAQSALIQRFDVNGTQNQQKILNAGLSKPMPISWGGTSSAPENATLQLAITDLNLGDWKAFAGELAPSGKLNTTLNVLSQQAGKQLSLSITSRVENLTATIGSNHVSQADVALRMQADIAEMQKISFRTFEIDLAKEGKSALVFKSSGTLNLQTSDADLKASMDGTLANLFTLIVVPDLTATAGTVKFDGQIAQRKEVKTVKGTFAVTDFSGTYAGSPLDRFGAKFNADFEVNQQDLQIRNISGDLQQANQPGGSLEVKGHYNSEKNTGNLMVKIADMNEYALRPFLAKSLGEKQLVTISVSGNTTAHLQADNSSFTGNLDLKNFVVRDPKQPQADAPLAAQVQLDGAMRKEVFDLKKFQVTLSPTERSKNQLNITGQLDMSKTNAIKGNLLVQSEAFDVTPFYNLYVAMPTNAATATASTPNAQPSPAPSNEEPEPVSLPVERIVAEINIGQFYLREIEIKDWRGTAKIEGSRVWLNPFQLTLNGAPVRFDADLNLGVKGYAYTINGSLDKVPLEPLANTFLPEKHGAYQGILIANAKIKGTGTTGVNLKNSLEGQATFTFTNANLQIVDKKYKNILTPISLALQIPEIANSPVKWLDTRLNFGSGNIELANFSAVSDSYRATMQATIPIADVLTNSPLQRIPVGFEVRKTLAERARISAAGTVSADGEYVKLPSLIRLEGTLGEPKSEIDKKGLATLAIQAGSGFIGGDAGKVLKGLGGILGGKAAATNAPGTTNNVTNSQPATNQLNINSVLDGLFNKKKK